MSTPTTIPKTSIEPYLNFDGRCEEAAEFYKKALGAEIEFMLRFKESPEPPKEGCTPPNSDNKIMHMSLRMAGSRILASDCRCGGKPNFEGISLALALPTEAEVSKAFAALSEGGEVQVPLEKTFFSPRFGVVTDRFGVTWMVLVSHQPA